MPLENAVMDWQVVGHSSGENGERYVGVVVVAAHRDTLGGLLDAVDRAGLRPVGIDLSAFGMVRALASESYEARTRELLPGAAEGGDRRGPAAQPRPRPAPTMGPDGLPRRGAAALLQSRRRHKPRGGPWRGTCLFTRISPFGVEG